MTSLDESQQFPGKQGFLYEDQTRIVCSSRLRNLKHRHRPTGLGELQPQPEFRELPHLDVLIFCALVIGLLYVTVANAQYPVVDAIANKAHQKIKPYQQLRYWSTVPFRHGPVDVVKHSATPSPQNPAHSL